MQVNFFERGGEYAERIMLAVCIHRVGLSSYMVSDWDVMFTIGVVDVSVERNAFGRQKDSFEAKVPVTGLDDPFHAVFIRAPLIDEVGGGVETLATVDGRPVAVRDGPVVATAFHPELTDDPRIHDLAFFPEREVIA